MKSPTPVLIEIPGCDDGDAVLRGARFEGPGGPRVLVTAGLHGDEVTSVAALWYVAERLAADPVGATVTVLPCVNPAAIRASSRTIPLDGSDVNRCFPGDRAGSTAERIAAALFALLEDHDALIDVHTAGLCVPFVLVDPVSDPTARASLWAWASASGLPVVGELAADRRDLQGLARSWSASAVGAGRPALTVELPGARTLLAAEARAGAAALHALLRAVSSTHGAAPSPSHRVEMFADAAGLLELEVTPGLHVQAGDVLACVRTFEGERRSWVRAQADALVLAVQPLSAVRAGSWVLTLAVEGDA